MTPCGRFVVPALLALLLSACGSTPSGDDDVCDCPDAACTDCELDAGSDAGAPADAPGADAGDAGAGLPLWSPCEILLDQCAWGLTCRYAGVAENPFLCQPYGPRAAMQSCVSVNDCGANMGCFQNGGGTRICLVFCDTMNPTLRCQVGETCYPQGGLPPEYPDETGVCGP